MFKFKKSHSKYKNMFYPLIFLHKYFSLFSLIFSTFYTLPIYSQNKLSSEVREILKNKDKNEPVEIIVFLVPEINAADFARELSERDYSRAEKHNMVMNWLQEETAKAQKPLMTVLNTLKTENSSSIKEMKAFRIFNGMKITSSASFVKELALREDVRFVETVKSPTSEKLEDVRMTPAGSRSVEWGLNAIGAPELWKKGITGKGRLVCAFDTGVDGTHPSLGSKWRGSMPGVKPEYAWLAGDGSNFPWDSDFHGTHVTGIMVGSTTKDTVGVAIRAKWIAAKVLGKSSVDIFTAFDWASDPDGNPETIEDVPDVINCSFEWGTQCSDILWEVIDNVEASGIAVIFPAGNHGPSPMTIAPPMDGALTSTITWATGALDKDLQIAKFSSRGPSPCDSISYKPEVAAPGVEIRSAAPGDVYYTLSSTGAAAPHVSGSIALLRQADPEIGAHQVKEVLLMTSKDLGDKGEDNNYGAGIPDLVSAYSLLVQGIGTLFGRVKEKSSGEPIKDALVRIKEAGLFEATGKEGKYDFTLTSGKKTILVKKFGFHEDSSEVVIVHGDSTEHNISMLKLPDGIIKGSVHDKNTGEPVRALINLYHHDSPYKTPLYSLFSDSLTGSFEKEIMVGDYDLSVSADVPYMEEWVKNAYIDSSMTTTVKVEVDHAPLLLIDDDLGENYESYITPPLDSTGVSYRLWDINVKGSPVKLISEYRGKTILWFTGDKEKNILTKSEEEMLSKFLDNGNSLFLSGQNIVEALNNEHSEFLVNRIHAGFEKNTTIHQISGILTDPLGSKVGDMATAGPTPPNNQNSEDILIPLDGAQVAMEYSGTKNPAACWYKDKINLSLVLILGFGLEGVHDLPGFTSREELLKTILEWNGTSIKNRNYDSESESKNNILYQNFPNPFNPETIIILNIPEKLGRIDINLSIYEMTGRLVINLIESKLSSGVHEISWNGKNQTGQSAASGVYYCRLHAGDKTLVRKMILLK